MNYLVHFGPCISSECWPGLTPKVEILAQVVARSCPLEKTS